MTTNRLELHGAHIRGSRRVSITGLEAIEIPEEELRQTLRGEVDEAVDRRRLPRHGAIGWLEYDTESGDVVDWSIEDKYLIESE